MNHGFERWNTPWQVLQRSLAEAFADQPSRAAGAAPLAAQNAYPASWLVRALGARSQANPLGR